MPWTQPRHILAMNCDRQAFNVGSVHTTGFLRNLIIMTKNFLLAASALTALAFAGAANAGTITSGKLSDVAVASTTGSTTTLTPFAVANEATLVGTVTSTDDAKSFVTSTLASPVAATSDSSVSFVITYTLTGPGTFGTVAVADLTAVSSVANAVAAPTGVATVSSDKKTATFIVTYGVTADTNITGFTFSKLDIAASAKQDISISSEVKLNAAGVQTTIDTVAETKIVTFKAALKQSAAAAYGVVADLPDFKKFEAKGAVAPSVANATTSTATSNPIALTVNANVHKDLATFAALSVSNILSGATATVTGPQVKALGATLAGASPAAATLTNTSGVYTLTPANLDAATVAGSLVLTVPTPSVAIEAGSYKVELKPTFADGFAGSADQTLTLLNVTLDGTNFYAPWFALNNGTANSTLRLGNNSASATGPVTITLKANNGSAAPTGSYVLSSGIPAGQFVSITGATLRTAFGTDAANGDLLVTIQSDVANVSAKVRTTQASGQIFENSLGANPPAN